MPGASLESGSATEPVCGQRVEGHVSSASVCFCLQGLRQHGDVYDDPSLLSKNTAACGLKRSILYIAVLCRCVFIIICLFLSVTDVLRGGKAWFGACLLKVCDIRFGIFFLCHQRV